MSISSFSGPKPDPPLNVTARLLPRDGGLNISWLPPPSRYGGSLSYGSAGVITHYNIEYRTVGQWVPLRAPIEADSSGNSYLWTTASRGVSYQFRIRSQTDTGVVGEASPVVTVHTTGKYGNWFIG